MLLTYSLILFLIPYSREQTEEGNCLDENLSPEFENVEAENWKTIWTTCGKLRPSPINIIENKAEFLKNCNQLDLSSYEKHMSLFSFQNKGYDVKIEPVESLSVTGGPLLNSVYILKSVHLHYGNQNNRMSEHQLNGQNFEDEIHFVHFNQKYSNITEATRKSDGLLVIAVWGRIGIEHTRNIAYQYIFDNIKRLSQSAIGTSESSSMGTPLIKLLPENISSFFYYEGSLTTPPCCETVRWIIFKNPVEISKKQLDEIEIIKVQDVSQRWITEAHSPNVRPVQDLNQRKVYFANC